MTSNYTRTEMYQKIQNEERMTEVYIPFFEEKPPVGVWARKRLQYLKDTNHPLYRELLDSGSLQSYLDEVDERARIMLSEITKQLAEKEKITEKLKAESPMKWVQAMNNIRNRAEEIVYAEVISERGRT